MQKVLFALLVLSFFISRPAIPQESTANKPFVNPGDIHFVLNTKSYGVSDGLSQNTVTAVAEDSEGYLWLGSLNGLNRFNGKEFKTYYADGKNGLSSAFILSLFSDGTQLYVGTDDGLFIYDKYYEKFLPTAISQQRVWSIASHDGRLILGLDNSIAFLDVTKKSVNLISNDSFKFIKKAYIFAGYLYGRNQNGTVVKCDAKGNQCEIIINESISMIRANNSLFIDTKTQTIEIDKHNKKTITENVKDAIGHSENNTAQLSDNILTQHWKKHLKTKKYKLEELYHLSNPEIFTFNSRIIITDTNRGFISAELEGNILQKISGTTGNIWSIHSYNDMIVVSDDSNTIKIFDQNLSLIKVFDSGITGFKTALVTAGNLIFIAHRDGVWAYDLNSNEAKREVFKINKSSYSIHYDELLNLVLVGTQDFEVINIDLNNNFETKTTKLDIQSPIFDISGSDGKYYIAHQEGVSRVNDDKTDKIYTDGIAYSTSVDNQNILIGLNDGIYSLNENNKNTKKILSSAKPIYSILSKNGQIFASSIGEAWLINGDKYYKLTSKNGGQEEYNNQSVSIYNEGVVFGGVDGLSVLNLAILDEYLSLTNESLNTTIDDLLIFNTRVDIGTAILDKAINFTQEIKVKYSDYPLTLEFSTPKTSTESVGHFYRLVGLVDEWIPSMSNKHATFTNLSPGNYTFEVYAVDKLSNRSGKEKHLKITVTPPWWMSKEAKLAYTILVFFISMIIIKAILKRREVQHQIAISEERLKLSLWGSGDEMWDWDIETGKIYRSNIWGSLEFPRDGHRSGNSDEESNIHPQDQQRVREELNRHFYGETNHFEAAYRVKGKDEQWVWILDRAKIVERDATDNALRMTGTIKNINSFKLAEEQLKLFERAIENISEGMFILDSNFCFVEVNEACCDICLIDRERFIGSTLTFSCYPETYSEQVRGMLRQQGSWSAEVDYEKGDASVFLMELTLDAIYDEQGTLSHFVGVFSDISRRKQQEEELRKLTNNDLLTGLPNRSNLQVSLSNLVKKDTHHTLMVLDLDNFKKINDSLGHQIGDELLLMASKRIATALPHHTSLYRLGGDEFAILVDKQTDIGSSAAIAKGMVDAFDLPFELAGEKMVVSVSIGIVLYPDDEQNEQALLRKADIAMYHAKSAGGNGYQFYSEALNRNAIRQLEIENLIREGLRDDLFEVYYQPKIDLKHSRLAGMEALVRLVHPTYGIIPPSDFIPLAEDTGLIIDIGDLVLRKACFAAQKWRTKGLFNGRVAVNLSSRQFALPDLQQRIESILRLTQLPAANLELEITEGTVIKHPEDAIKVMQQLSKMGVSLALDDFGTGYSSLSYLKRFPIHCLKIDKAFVDDIDKSDKDLKMVDSIITIAHNMGLTVVGEGVEAPAQLNILRALNCEEVQGYIYSKALPEREFGELLTKDFSEFISKKYYQ